MAIFQYNYRLSYMARAIVIELTHSNTLETYGYAPVIRLKMWKWRFLANMATFTLTKRIFRDSQILSHLYHFEAQLVGNNIWKKIGILSSDFLAILICIYKSKLLVIRFSSHTIRRTKSPPQSHLALRKHSSTKSY